MTEPPHSRMPDTLTDSRVLVVDDREANTALVTRLLARAGLREVTPLNDSRAVRGMLPLIDPDLVLLDLRMPHVDGFAVLGIIQQFAAGAYLPVIVITADDSQASVEQALAMGAHDYLRKPFDATELTLRVRNLLLTRQAFGDLRRSRTLLRERLDVFEPELAGMDDQEQVRQRIRQVIDEDAVPIALQPIVHLADGTVFGYEALSRFPAGPPGSPAAWFLAAERVGMSGDLEGHTVRKALDLLPALPGGTGLAVNVSPRALLSGGMPDLSGDRLIVELTEHTPVEDYAVLERALTPLRERGVRLAVDDTGAGFASLRHILAIGPDLIKIDTGIVRDVHRDRRRSAIARMLAQFAADQGALAVAEGVETVEEHQALADLGIELGQGFHFGRPEVPHSGGTEAGTAGQGPGAG